MGAVLCLWGSEHMPSGSSGHSPSNMWHQNAPRHRQRPPGVKVAPTEIDGDRRVWKVDSEGRPGEGRATMAEGTRDGAQLRSSREPPGLQQESTGRDGGQWGHLPLEGLRALL